MKLLKLSLVITAAGLVTIGLSGMAYAFHNGGVAYCEGCHTMHNSVGGVAQAKKGASTPFDGYNYLLKGSDQSSTCLNCHASSTLQNLTSGNGISIMTYPVPTGTGSLAPYYRSPGGDFGWMAKTYGTGTQNPGYTHGHNINAIDYNLPSGGPPTTAAPGGSYLQANLHCTSCHDPHPSTRIVSNPVTPSSFVKSAIGSATLPIVGSGSYGALPNATTGAVGVYRLLGGVGYLPLSYSGGPPFTNPPPVAVAPSTYNITEAVHDVRVAYGSGMSEWCYNCHPTIYNDVASVPVGGSGTVSLQHIHPNGAAALLTANANIGGTTATIAQIYNAYKKSGDLTGSQSTSYTSLVPYEEGSNDMAFLLTHVSAPSSSTSATYYVAGPITGTENVHCLSCHRSHASGFPQATRWYNNTQFITQASAYPGSGTLGSSSNYMPQADYQAAMYDRPASNYATYQRVLCNKCHGKD